MARRERREAIDGALDRRHAPRGGLGTGVRWQGEKGPGADLRALRRPEEFCFETDLGSGLRHLSDITDRNVLFWTLRRSLAQRYRIEARARQGTVRYSSSRKNATGAHHSESVRRRTGSRAAACVSIDVRSCKNGNHVKGPESALGSGILIIAELVVTNFTICTMQKRTPGNRHLRAGRPDSSKYGCRRKIQAAAGPLDVSRAEVRARLKGRPDTSRRLECRW